MGGWGLAARNKGRGGGTSCRIWREELGEAEGHLDGGGSGRGGARGGGSSQGEAGGGSVRRWWGKGRTISRGGGGGRGGWPVTAAGAPVVVQRMP
jgi:hypothetical protein